jgi:hypothetical protein
MVGKKAPTVVDADGAAARVRTQAVTRVRWRRRRVRTQAVTARVRWCAGGQARVVARVRGCADEGGGAGVDACGGARARQGRPTSSMKLESAAPRGATRWAGRMPLEGRSASFEVGGRNGD